MSWPLEEDVANALFAVAVATVNNVATLTVSSRVFKWPSQVSAAMTPALYQLQVAEDFERTAGISGPAKRTMHFEEWIYVATPKEPSVAPSTALNAIVNAMQDAFAPSATTGFLMILNPAGQRVAIAARIRGRVQPVENFEGTGRSFVIVPLEVILP